MDDLGRAVKVARLVVPILAEQARLERLELSGGLPTSEAGADYSADPGPYYGDPTGEAVVNFRPPRDGGCDPSRDLVRIAEMVGDGQRLLGSLRRLLNQVPAVTLAVTDGRKATDGRSAEEHEQRRFVRALTDNRCLVGQDHAVEDRFGPGQLRRGLCDRHRKAFGRWEQSRLVWLAGVDPGERLVRWQAETYGTVAGGTVGDGVVVELEAYKTRGVKRVA